VVTSRVPGCVVTLPDDVLDVTVHFPNELLFVTPPFAEPDLFLGI
jgi:hypothetical protein